MISEFYLRDNASEMRGSLAPRMTQVNIASLLGLSINFIYLKEICTKLRGSHIVAFFVSHNVMGPIVQLMNGGISYDF